MPGDKLRVLLIPTQVTGVMFYRMFNYAVASWRMGSTNFDMPWFQWKLHTIHPWQVDIKEPEHYYRIMAELWERYKLCDAVVIQMVHTPSALNLVRAFKEVQTKGTPWSNKPVLAEVDDDFLWTPSYNPAAPAYDVGQPLREIAKSQFSDSDGIIVSTPHLKEVYQHLNPNIYVVPNAIDFQIWDKAMASHKKRPGIRIGWAGGANHEDDFKGFEQVINNVTAKYRDVKFVFVHGIPERLRKLPGVEFVPKFYEMKKYAKGIADLDFDIGIAPLIDNSFNRGKSNLRWLEYSAMSIPTVASNVGNFKETVKDGVDGLLANNLEEFEKHLCGLIENKAWRREMGRAAYARVYRDFNTEVVCETYSEAVNSAIQIRMDETMNADKEKKWIEAA